MPDPSSRTTRTRRDLVAAAIACWSDDSAASLGVVAERAGVGRTTLNRYFSDRTQLLAAVDQECRVRFAAAYDRARPTEGTGLAALQRIAVELVALDEVLGLVFADQATVDPDTWAEDGTPDEISAVAARGQADGSLADDLPLEWLVTQLWTSLFGAWLVTRSGGTTRHEAGRLLTRTLAHGLGATAPIGSRP